MIIKHSVSTAETIKVETLPGWVADKTKVAKAEEIDESEVKTLAISKKLEEVKDLGE